MVQTCITIEKVNVFDLMIGTQKEITTLDGKKLNIIHPRLHKPGTVLSITEQGLPMQVAEEEDIYISQYKQTYPNITDPKYIE